MIQTGKSTIMWNDAIVCEDEVLRKNERWLGSCLGSYVIRSLPELYVPTIQGLYGKRKGIIEWIKGLFAYLMSLTFLKILLNLVQREKPLTRVTYQCGYLTFGIVGTVNLLVST